MKRLADVDAQPPKRIKMSEGFSDEIDNDEGYLKGQEEYGVIMAVC